MKGQNSNERSRQQRKVKRQCRVKTLSTQPPVVTTHAPPQNTGLSLKRNNNAETKLNVEVWCKENSVH